MSIPLTDIIALVDSEQNSDYKKWKALRPEILSKIGLRIVNLTENEITELFKAWENRIMANLSFDKQRSIMNTLMAFSVLFHFQDDMDQIKNLLRYIFNLLGHKTPDVFYAAARVLYWIAIEMQDGHLIFREPNKLAFDWINTNSKKSLNALAILKYSKISPDLTIIHSILKKFDQIFKLATSEDVKVRLLASKVIILQIKRIEDHTSLSYLVEPFAHSIDYLIKNVNAQAHGALRIIRSLITVNPELLVPQIDTVTRIIKELSANSYDDVAIDTYKFALDISKTNKFEISEDMLSVIINNLLTKCYRGVQADQYFQLLDKYIRFYTPQLDTNIEKIMAFITKCLTNGSKRISSPALGILATMLELFSSIHFDPKALVGVYPCDNFILCLKRRMNYMNTVKNYLYEAVRSGLDPRKSPNEIVLALKLARNFPYNLFEQSQFFPSIQPLMEVQAPTIKIELIKTLATIKTQEAISIMVFNALYDPSKKVRLASVESLEPSEILSMDTRILLTLNDASFKVRRKALELIGTLVKMNPFALSAQVSEYVTFVMTAAKSVSSVKIAAKYASLLPIIALKYKNLVSSMAPQIIQMILSVLCPESSDVIGGPLRDDFTDPNCFLQTMQTRKRTEPKKYKIFSIVNRRFFDERDESYLKTLAGLGELVSPFLDHVLLAFYNVFTQRKSKRLLAGAAKALAQLCTTIDGGMNLRSVYPQMVPALMKLLSNGSKEVSIGVLKLLGTACDAHSLLYSPETEVMTADLGVDVKNASFYTDFVLNHLIPHLDNPDMQLFEAIAFIFQADPSVSAKFAERVIPAFINAISTVNDKNISILFVDLAAITSKCQSEAILFLPELTKVCMDHISNLAAMRLCTSLSFNLKGSFSLHAKLLFRAAIPKLKKLEISFFGEVVRFLTSCILHQQQPFELVIAAYESLLGVNHLRPQFIKKICASLTCLVQNASLDTYHSRIALVSNTILRLLDPTDRDCWVNLVFSMAITMSLPLNIIEFWAAQNSFTIPSLPELRKFLKSNNKSIRAAKFIKQKVPKCKPIELKVPEIREVENIFVGLPDTDELNSGKWLQDLCDLCIAASPSPAIRSCAKIIGNIPQFYNALFPIAFLSVWEKTDFVQRSHFSSIVKHVLNNFHVKSPFFSQIAELLDRANMPLLIDDETLANGCNSSQFKLYLLQRVYRKNPRNTKNIENLMELNTAMGRNSSARGLLADSKDLLDLESAGRWSELLGEWNKALEIFSKTDKDSQNRISCLLHLEAWDEIISLENNFDHFTKENKQKYAHYFALAFYHKGDLKKASHYTHFFPPELSLSEIFFMSLFFIKSKKFEEAEQVIQRGLNSLAADTATYSSGDEYRVHENISYAQVFVELEEVLEIKKKYQSEKVSPEVAAWTWNKRLKSFKRDSENWIRLIRIRSIIFDPNSYIQVYLKMINVLRKERCWNLIDTYFNEIFETSTNPEVEYVNAKVMWARGNREEAIQSLRFVKGMFEMGDIESFMDTIPLVSPNKVLCIMRSLKKLGLFDSEMMSTISDISGDKFIGDPIQILAKHSKDEIYGILMELCKRKPEKLYNSFVKLNSVSAASSEVASSVYRTLASYINAGDHLSIQELQEVVGLFDKAKARNQTDPRAWIGWANANAKLIQNTSANIGQYSMNAVTGFLKATQLTGGNLDTLCLMFSIFFQMNDCPYVKTVSSEILALPAKIIIQIIPQIAVQIAHSDPAIRNVVHTLLTNFGRDHYQAIFFPLKLYEHSSSVKKAEIAHDILQNLSKRHVEESADSELFADGMLRSAISWFEDWRNAIDSASHAQHEGDMKRMDMILERQFRKYEQPVCDFDRWFIRSYDSTIQQARQNFKSHTTQSLRMMWELFKYLWSQIGDRLKMLDLILLSKVSEKLATKQGFSIAIPGTYQIDSKCPKLDRIELALTVLSTQQHPRCVTMVANDGCKFKFLLKGNEDLRLDQRVMQFFVLINSLLKTGRAKRELNTQIAEYAIIPLSPNAGLISWVTGSDTIHQMINEMRIQRDQPQGMEFDVITRNTNKYFNTLSNIQILEQFENIAKEFPADEIREILWAKSPSAGHWLTKTRNFSITNAVMSMVGYIIGLGDRHPSNIMVQRETGKVVHIDFGDSFETAVLRKNFPEKVPFRLTRMIVNALDNGSVEGMFRRACNYVMYLLRDNMDPLVAQLEIFIHEPLDDRDRPARTVSQNIVERVVTKLRGRDTLYDDSLDPDKDLTVEEQVQSLISVASDPARYVTHYTGWCAFW